jgi:aspartate aminotransferase-like enzyme
MLTGAQKALALPPGFSLFSVSEKGFRRAEEMPNRGFYFDFLEFKRQQAEWMTPSTPSIGHIYALASKLEDIFAEGLAARCARHLKLAQMTREWAGRHGFTLFPEPGYESVTLTCVNNGAKPGGRVVDAAGLQKLVKDKGFLIDAGYGKIKGTTFRISNMGDETEETMGQLYAAMDQAMKQL